MKKKCQLYIAFTCTRIIYQTKLDRKEATNYKNKGENLSFPSFFFFCFNFALVNFFFLIYILYSLSHYKQSNSLHEFNLYHCVFLDYMFFYNVVYILIHCCEIDIQIQVLVLCVKWVKKKR